MGWITHHAIIVTGADWKPADHLIRDAHEKATALGCIVTPIVTTMLNGFASFMVCPDGSKEGWTDSDIGDGRRAAFKQWLVDHTRYGDGGSHIDWTEVEYSPDGAGSKVVDHRWKRRPLPAEPYVLGKRCPP